MLLLRLRVANHRSIRDEVELSLVSPHQRGATPPDGDWVRASVRTAGIYGANASGKSTVLDALEFLVSAVRYSASRWGNAKRFPHSPFALDPRYRSEHSLYELDFVTDAVRYSFGFRSNPDGVAEEWLYSYPNGRRRLLYERTGAGYEFGRHLIGENIRLSRSVRPNVLYLSFAASNGHPFLGRLHEEIASHIQVARLRQDDRYERLRWIERLIEDDEARWVVGSLLRLADFGISDVRTRLPVAPDSFERARQQFFRVRSDHGLELPDEDSTEASDMVERGLVFLHGPPDSDGEVPELTLAEESKGTIGWLALVVPAYFSIQQGEVFVVDEIDSSLHPRLSSTLIDLFKNEQLNSRGAQLVFTSHDTSLLSSLHGSALDAAEIWFTEKSPEGVTDLYSLAEFPVRSRDNFERRYLHGRYGAVPVVSHSEIVHRIRAKAG